MAFWGPFGASFGHLLGLLRACRRSLGSPWGGGLEISIRVPPLGPLLGLSWAVLDGAVLGAPWAVLGPSWGLLGQSWGDLGGLSGGLGRCEDLKSECAEHVRFPAGMGRNWPREALSRSLQGPSCGSWGASGAVWKSSWAVLERSWGGIGSSLEPPGSFGG